MGLVGRYRSAVIVAVLSLLLALSVTVETQRSQSHALEEAAATQASVVTAGLVAATSAGTALVDSLGGLFDASESVTPEEFETFAARSLDQTTIFRAVQFSRVVSDAQRASYEADLAERGLRPGILVAGVDGALVTAPRRERYVAVTMQAPAAEPEDAYGLDISFSPPAADLIAQVTMAGQPGIGAWTQPGRTGVPGLFIFAPVFRQGAPTATPEQRTASLLGIVGAEMHYEAVLQTVPTSAGAQFAVLLPHADGPDGNAVTTPTVLYSSAAPAPDAGSIATWPITQVAEMSGIRLVVAARPSPTATAGGLAPWGAGMLVLLAGLMLAAYLGRSTEQRRLVRVTRQLQEANDRLRFLSEHDSLTGLMGRETAQRMLQEWMTAPGPPRHVAAMFVDIDRFGLVNSTWGHPVGDEVLRQLADRLHAFIDDTTMVARIGGDEFLLIRVGGTVADLRIPGTARGIQQTLAEPVAVGQARQSFTTSIGVALFPVDGEDASRLIAKADAAVRSAKALGTGQVVIFNPEVEAAEADRIDIERQVSIALREVEVPFQMVYQPQVDMADGRCVGLEALIRWPAHPAGPGEFIPVAERSGLIVPLGRYVAREVVRQVRRWNDAGVPVPLVAFNVSADQFVEDFAHRLLAVLDDEDVAPRTLEIEITEYSAMRETAHVQLERLRRRGVSVAIDDFGTGFSSLARLARLPVDRLKIDHSFIAGLPQDITSVEVVRTIADLSRSFNLEVVCEGVQTDAQVDVLLGMGLRIAQGFRYARPMPPDEVPAFLRSKAVVLTGD